VTAAATHVVKADHLAIACRSIADALPLYQGLLGGRFRDGGDNDLTGTRFVHLDVGGFKVELMEPLRPDSAVQEHLDRRGPGMHHFTFLVDDVVQTITDFEAAGMTMVGTRLDVSAYLETFVHPRQSEGALIQLVETSLPWTPRTDITLADVLAGRVVWREAVSCLREAG
jgi:methylmalonyl-CoA epimerase